MSKCLFVTGTGTDVGKTYITALMVKKLRDFGINAGYYKAAISGINSDTPNDAEYVKKISGIEENWENLVSYTYREAVSPHLAAKINNQPIEWEVIERDFNRAKEKYDYLTVEGSGGIICPLRYDDNERFILDDMVCQMKLSVVVVSNAGLGMINSTVLTVEHLQSRNIPIKGIIINNYHAESLMEQDNLKMTIAMTGVPIMAVVPPQGKDLAVDCKTLTGLYE